MLNLIYLVHVVRNIWTLTKSAFFFVSFDGPAYCDAQNEHEGRCDYPWPRLHHVETLGQNWWQVRRFLGEVLIGGHRILWPHKMVTHYIFLSPMNSGRIRSLSAVVAFLYGCMFAFYQVSLQMWVAYCSRISQMEYPMLSNIKIVHPQTIAIGHPKNYP